MGFISLSIRLRFSNSYLHKRKWKLNPLHEIFWLEETGPKNILIPRKYFSQSGLARDGRKGSSKISISQIKKEQSRKNLMVSFNMRRSICMYFSPFYYLPYLIFLTLLLTFFPFRLDCP